MLAFARRSPGGGTQTSTRHWDGHVFRPAGLRTRKLAMRRAVELEPENCASHFGMGTVLRALERHGEAAGSLNAPLPCSPPMFSTCSFLGPAISISTTSPPARH